MLHGGFRLRARQTDEDVGRRAVPAFGQRLLGDDEAHRTVLIGDAARVFLLDLLQPAFFARRHDDVFRGDALVGDQVVAHALPVQRVPVLAASLRLDQHQWPQVRRTRAVFRVRRRLQLLALVGGVGQAFLPVAFGFKQDRQLDHLLRLQLHGGNAVQHVARGFFGIRRCGQFEDAAGIECGQRGERQIGAVVVRLVHDQERPAQTQHVGQRIWDRPVLVLQQARALQFD